MSRREFSARLVACGPKGSWTGVKVPFFVPAVFATRRRVAARGWLQGQPFFGSIVPSGDGAFYLPFRREYLNAAGVSRGDSVEVVVEPVFPAPTSETAPAPNEPERHH